MHIECPVCGAFFDEDTNTCCPRCLTPADLFSGCGGCGGCGRCGKQSNNVNKCCSSGCCQYQKAESS